MKDFLSKIFMLRLNWVLGFLNLILVSELAAQVIATKPSGKSCFLYAINEYEPSPWFSIQSNHDTTVILENMPITAPVNITLKKYQSEDIFCLLSVRLHKINIYGSCILGDQQHFILDNNIDDKTLVLHVHESIFQLSVEDVMVKLNPLTPEISGLTHDTPEWMDKVYVFDGDQYVIQITSDTAEENRLHAAVGCEYDMDDECIMEFEKTILCIKNETTLMALSNSTELEGEVFVHYGNSDFKRKKPLVMTLPLTSLEEVNTWEEVANVAPQFIDREGSEGYILYLDKNLIYSPRSPGLVGTVREKELILDFTHTKNVKWGVPCPEKPESLDKSFTVITTTPENDAEIFIPDGSNEEIESDMLTSMVRGELDQIKAIIDSNSQPELEELELEPDFDPVNEAKLDEPIPESLLEPGDNDGPESASVKSNSGVMEGANQLMMQWVGAGTSPVDWCEDNYTVTPHIAEFVNTFSNILFLVVPAACSQLWSSYARQVSRGIYVVWIFFTLIGLSSAYFHATLSLLGQLLDELSILWVLMLSYMLFTPNHFRPSGLCDNPQRYSAVIILLASIITASAFVQPAINAYALFLLGGPAIAMLVYEVRASRDPAISRLGHITIAALSVAGAAWIGDRFLCAVWKAIDLTVLHGVWHIFIFIGSYATQVLICYFHADQDVPESKPSLRYWPNDTWLGLPYVYCKADKLNKTP